MDFNYLTCAEIEKFAFFRVPKRLFTDDRFRRLSTEARVLYGIMLDRAGLSIQNRWVDVLGRVYIIFPVAEIVETMDVSRQKALNLLCELDAATGIGLIERRRTGRADRIYVMDFNSCTSEEPSGQTQPDNNCAAVGNEPACDANLSDNSASFLARSKNGISDIPKLDRNNTNKETEQSYSSSIGMTDERETSLTSGIALSKENALAVVGEQTALLPDGRTSPLTRTMKDVLLETYTCPSDTLHIGRTETTAVTARKAMLVLTPEEIKAAYDRISASGQLRSPRAYCFKTLITPPDTPERQAPRKDNRSWERQYTTEYIGELEKMLLAKQQREE